MCFTPKRQWEMGNRSVLAWCENGFPTEPPLVLNVVVSLEV